MNKTKWSSKLKKALSPLPKEEREKISEYYEEMYLDKRDAGLEEEAILAEFGPPEEAAKRFLQEYPTQKSKKGNAVGRFFLALTLFLFVGLPVAAVLFALAVTGAALFLSGFAIAAAGIADIAYFIVQICASGAGGAFVAHIGIGLAAVGAGCLLIPLFLYLTKKLFILCGKLFAVTGRFIRGKREAL